MTEKIRGVLAPVVTPFKADLSPDPQRFVAHCKWLLSQNCGLAVFGTNSEANSMSSEEREKLLDVLVSAGVDPSRMMPGTGCCSITETVRLTARAVKRDCAGVLMLPPFYYKQVSEDGLYAYFSEVVQRVSDSRLKIYLYHIPSVAIVGISPRLVERLLKDYPGTIAGMKDSSGDWNNTAALLERFPGFSVFPGSEVFLLDGLRKGGVGCITATGNVNVTGIRKVYENWRTPQADQLQAEITNLRKTIQAYPMVPALKRIVAHFHHDPDWAAVRPPMVPLTEAQSAALIGDLARVGFTLGERRREAAE